jgi:exopolysaccharide production protein ExoZ
MRGDILEKRSTYHYPLDAVRFFAALLVALFHLGFYSWASEYSTTARIFEHADTLPKLVSTTWFGWIGVNIFFVISGFVIANSANGASAFSFLKSRLIRLYPAAWICATITLVVWLVIAHRPASDLLGPYARAMALWPLPNWIDGVYWSLAVEISFYATIFLLLLFDQFKRLTLYAWVLTLLPSVFIFADRYGLVPQHGWLSAHSSVLLLHDGALFAIGIWMWKSSARRITIPDCIGVAIATGAALVGINERTQSLQMTEAPAASGFSIEWPMIIWITTIVLLFGFTRWPGTFRPRSPNVRALMRTFGRATYPLYLVHNVVGAGMMRVLVHKGVTPYWALVIALWSVVALAAVIAAIAEPYVGAQLRRALNKAESLLARAPLARTLMQPRQLAN